MSVSGDSGGNNNGVETILFFSGRLLLPVACPTPSLHVGCVCGIRVAQIIYTMPSWWCIIMKRKRSMCLNMGIYIYICSKDAKQCLDIFSSRNKNQKSRKRT
jgi:hypothetical protein